LDDARGWLAISTSSSALKEADQDVILSLSRLSVSAVSVLSLSLSLSLVRTRQREMAKVVGGHLQLEPSSVVARGTIITPALFAAHVQRLVLCFELRSKGFHAAVSTSVSKRTKGSEDVNTKQLPKRASSSSPTWPDCWCRAA